eukprot:gene17834-24218_t
MQAGDTDASSGEMKAKAFAKSASLRSRAPPPTKRAPAKPQVQSKNSDISQSPKNKPEVDEAFRQRLDVQIKKMNEIGENFKKALSSGVDEGPPVANSMFCKNLFGGEKC